MRCAAGRGGGKLIEVDPPHLRSRAPAAMNTGIVTRRNAAIGSSTNAEANAGCIGTAESAAGWLRPGCPAMIASIAAAILS